MMMRLRKQVVWLDTNFLLIPGRWKVDIFTQIEHEAPGMEFRILDSQLKELDSIIQGKSSRADKNAAKLALLLIKQKSLKMVSGSSKASVDDQLVAKTKPGDLVATQDKELKQRLKDKGICILVLRQKKHIVKE